MEHPMKLDEQLLRSVPKVLLHEHLDGVLRPQTVIELANAARYYELPTNDPQGLATWFHQDALPLTSPAGRPKKRWEPWPMSRSKISVAMGWSTLKLVSRPSFIPGMD